jgi:hypothetical protein
MTESECKKKKDEEGQRIDQSTIVGPVATLGEKRGLIADSGETKRDCSGTIEWQTNPDTASVRDVKRCLVGSQSVRGPNEWLPDDMKTYHPTRRQTQGNTPRCW